MAQAALRPELLDEFLERNILVLVGTEGGVTHLLHQREERSSRVDPGSQGEAVDEEADEALRLGVGAAGDGGADDDVLLSGVAGQQGLEASQQRHEGGQAVALGEGLEGLGQVPRQSHGQPGAPVGRDGRPGSVGGQFQECRRIEELLLPPAELSVERLALEPVALPGGVVGVLHGERRKRGAGVERGHLAHEHAHGPTVGDDVVHVEGEHVLGGAQLQQPHAQQRAGGEVEGAERVLLELALQFLAVELHYLQRHLGMGGDALEGLALPLEEGGAQRLMAMHHFVEGAAQGLRVELPLHAHEGGHVVGGAAGLKLVDEPQALLGEGEGQLVRVSPREEQRLHPSLERGETLLLHLFGEPREGGRGEQLAQGQLDAEEGTEPGDDSSREQGVAAQLEEVVVGTDSGNAQQLSPEVRQQRLGRRARREVRGGQRL